MMSLFIVLVQHGFRMLCEPVVEAVGTTFQPFNGQGLGMGDISDN